jgi:DNA-binding transcriptional LysR family regulator
VRLARATQEEIQPVVTIGHSPYVDPALISSLLSVHLPLYPNLRLHMETMFALELAHSVLSVELDLAIIAEPSESPLLTLVPLETVPLYTLMSSDHPAAKQGSISVQELGGVRILASQERFSLSIRYHRSHNKTRISSCVFSTRVSSSCATSLRGSLEGEPAILPSSSISHTANSCGLFPRKAFRHSSIDNLTQ